MSQVISASPSPDVITINELTKSLPDGPSPNVSTPQVDISITPEPGPPPPPLHTWFYLKYALVILVLAALGFNLFFAMGDVTESVRSFLSPILSLVGIGVGNTVKGTAQTAAGATSPRSKPDGCAHAEHGRNRAQLGALCMQCIV